MHLSSIVSEIRWSKVGRFRRFTHRLKAFYSFEALARDLRYESWGRLKMQDRKMRDWKMTD